MVYIIRSDYGPHKFLHEVVFFVGAFRRRKSCYRIRAMFFLDCRQFLRDKIEGFIPACFFQLTIFSDERHREPFRALDKIKTKSSFYAEMSIVRSVIVSYGLDEKPFFVCIEIDFASHTAINADTRFLRQFPVWPFPEDGLKCKRAGRTELNAGTAFHAA